VGVAGAAAGWRGHPAGRGRFLLKANGRAFQALAQESIRGSCSWHAPRLRARRQANSQTVFANELYRRRRMPKQARSHAAVDAGVRGICDHSACSPGPCSASRNQPLRRHSACSRELLGMCLGLACLAALVQLTRVAGDSLLAMGSYSHRTRRQAHLPATSYSCKGRNRVVMPIELDVVVDVH